MQHSDHSFNKERNRTFHLESQLRIRRFFIGVLFVGWFHVVLIKLHIVVVRVCCVVFIYSFGVNFDFDV